MRILFVDFEASSLWAGSFPIEVAWVDEDGRGESHLIRPHADWLDGAAGHPGWDPRSAAIHGIRLETLLADGVPAERVAERAAEALGRVDVVPYSDNPGFDERWLATLVAVGGIRRSIRLMDVRELHGWACRPLLDLRPLDPAATPEQARRRFQAVVGGIVARAEETESRRPRVRHRALADAESQWRTWRAVRDEVARLVAEAGP